MLPERIVVIDDDLGVSGTGTRLRTGFQDMLALISSGQVGAVFAVHESRLARNMWDFVQFITTCERHRVLLVIDGAVKDPGEDRDRLLTLVMGTFADYENRDRMRQLRSALLTKMKTEKCALTAPPAGYDAPVEAMNGGAGRRRRWGSQWVKSADVAIVQALETLFAQFALLGTIGAVVRYFRSHHLHWCPAA
jgi:DNA invertase Pin-like site-specific DNA recombinase